jgi:hypothetical protein
LEKGVDDGQKKDAKRFCCVGSVAVCLGLDKTRRGGSSEVVSGVTYVEL